MAVGEIILSGFLQTLFEKLTSNAVSLFLKLFKGGKSQLKTLKEWERKLRIIDALLIDAEEKQGNNRVVQLWLQNLQDLAYDLEDILDDFAAQALLHDLENNAEGDDDVGDELKTRNITCLSSPKNMVKCVLACGSRAVQQFYCSGADHSSKIDEISFRLEEIQTQAETLGLSARIMQQDMHSTEAPKQSWRETSSLVCELVIYGRDDIKNQMIGHLVKDEPSYENYVVFPIVGMGGIGKTTLAQYVYNDEQVMNHFDLKAWVCVSDVFDVTRITTAIINSLTKKNCNFSNLNQAQEELREVLHSKKFLLVLDDIWTEIYNDWNSLQTPFHQGLKGSRVIITTRNENIARMVIRNPSHSTTINLEGLSNDDCWRLFQQHSIEDSDLAEMRNDVVKKCRGLPLAAKALAGLIKSTVEKGHRQTILESNIWSEQSSVLPALSLSYHHMPPHLKPIFAYCSIFPKDYKFEEMEVVLLWMAQGFLPENRKDRMEDIGHRYFMDLVSRSLFERSSSNENCFIMHDLVHDLAQWAAGDICCVMDTLDMHRHLIRTRHLNLTKNVIDETLGNQIMAPHQLRTFACSGLNIEFLYFIQRLRYIRSLLLASDKVEVLPECIGDLKHLRYLRLALPQIQVLPKSIGKLCYLQTLNLDACVQLQDFTNMKFLIKLRHLRCNETLWKTMPLGIGKLTNLQSLGTVYLAYGHGSLIRELRNLNHLHGELRISRLENVTTVEDAKEAQLHKKYGLDKLFIDWKICRDKHDKSIKRDVLQELQPHTSIKECELNGYRGLTFPAWLGDPSFAYMIRIKLMGCECECLPPLGQLPSLKELWVVRMQSLKEVGPEFYAVSNPFPALTTLFFKGMNSWNKWLHPSVDKYSAFPRLEKLLIEKCPSLQGHLPPHLPFLKELTITKCHQLSVSLPTLFPLNDLMIGGCKAFSSTATVTFCLNKMILCGISELTNLYVHGPCRTLTGVDDQLPVRPGLLEIDDCQELQYVEFKDLSPTSSCVKEFSLRNCQNLVTLGHLPLTLRQLEINDCASLASLLFKRGTEKGLEVKETACSSAQGTTNAATDNQLGLFSKAPFELCFLTKLTIYKCPRLNSLPDDLLLPSLQELTIISYTSLENLPKHLHNFTSLKSLTICNCPKIQYFPEGGLPRSLKSLELEDMNITQPMGHWRLDLLTHLQQLELCSTGSSSDSVECIPGPDLYLPSSLSELNVGSFKNLKSVTCADFFNLTRLFISDGPMLISLGGNHLPPKLEYVGIGNCSLMEQKCKSDPHGPIRIGQRPGTYSYSMC